MRCQNIDEFGLPSFITAYNAKPVLIRNTGTLIRGTNYIEMDINVHRFASVPKQALQVQNHKRESVLPKLQTESLALTRFVISHTLPYYNH